MKFPRRANTSHGSVVDMTPMIDIVFLLLVFFLTTAQMASQSRAEIDLPQELGEETEDSERAGLIVNVLADGTIIVSDREVRVDELETLAVNALVASETTLRPLVRADRNAPTARLNEVLLTLRRGGIDAVRVATSPGR